MMMTMMTTNTDINPDDLIKHHCFSFGVDNNGDAVE